MRRFQPAPTMMSSKRSIAYEMVGGRASHPHLSKDRLVKLTAAAVVSFVALSAVHTLMSPGELVYGLMIDAGSTGSRMHTFSFDKGHDMKLNLTSEDFLAIKPGLSAFKDNPTNAPDSLKPLLARAQSIVPSHLRAQTPVFLRATAGLRMAGEETAELILSNVRTSLKASGFRFDDDSWASILGGNDEGIYSWITVNYLLNRAPGNTVGTLEMGGGSSQVAYVPRDTSLIAASGNCSLASEPLDFKGSRLSLYTYSHLKYGLKKARAVALENFETESRLVDNPCINKGSPVKTVLPFDETGKELTLTGTGDYTSCRKLVDEILAIPARGECDCDACTYHGLPQPRPVPEYVAIAFYLERTVALGLTTPLTVADIRTKGEEICGMSVKDVEAKYTNVPNGVASDLCFDLAFITSHLENGHGLHESLGTKLMVVDKIKGVELGWSLGGMFAEMSRLGIGA